jgi:hypothetical protein
MTLSRYKDEHNGGVMKKLTELIDEKLKIAEGATKGPWRSTVINENRLGGVYVPLPNTPYGSKASIMFPNWKLHRDGDVDDAWIQCKKTDSEFIASTRDGKLDYEQALRALKIALDTLEDIDMTGDRDESYRAFRAKEEIKDIVLAREHNGGAEE